MTSVGSLAVISMHTSPLAQPGAGDGGGLNVYVRGLTSALAANGTDVTIFTRRTSGGTPPVVELGDGSKLVSIDAGPCGLTKADLPAVVETFATGVGEHLRDNPPDALHAHYWLSAAAAHRLKHQFGLPLGVTFHTLERVKAKAGHPETHQRADVEQQVIGCADVVFTSGPAEADLLAAHYDVDPRRVHHLTPGVNLATFSPGQQTKARAAIGLRGDQLADPVVLFVGRLQPLKGADVALAAFNQLRCDVAKRARLMVVGGPSGPAGDATLCALRQQVAQLGLDDRVRFVPPQPHKVLADYYRAADVCVVPSRSESFGLVALEAAACATPVVAANVGGLRDNVVDGHTGLLVDGHSPAGFATHIDELLTNPLLAMQLGQQGRERALRCTWAQSAEEAAAALGAAKQAARHASQVGVLACA